jgi:hypothetical protein
MTIYYLQQNSKTMPFLFCICIFWPNRWFGYTELLNLYMLFLSKWPLPILVYFKILQTDMIEWYFKMYNDTIKTYLLKVLTLYIMVKQNYNQPQIVGSYDLDLSLISWIPNDKYLTPALSISRSRIFAFFRFLKRSQHLYSPERRFPNSSVSSPYFFHPYHIAQCGGTLGSTST